MNKTERIFKIEQLIVSRRLVSFQELLDELEVSRATLKRDLEYLRSRMKSPIVYDRDANGYRIGIKRGDPERVAFPGLWFNAAEAAALLTMQHLLDDLQPGALRRHIEPLRERLKSLLESADHSFDQIRRRVRIFHMGRRAPPLKCFEAAAGALLNRRQLRIQYYSRASGEKTERVVSPQRLVCYRESWYLDAWCHLRAGLRSFAVDGIRRAEILDVAAQECRESELDEELAAGYGIFSGRARAWARLRFSPARARWVAAETWHPKQRAGFESDGSYVLEFPYADDRELIGDILRHGAEVEVLAPAALRTRCHEELAAAARRYDRKQS
jgi:predicted DNA-binding transcriptional regulator YafY